MCLVIKYSYVVIVVWVKGSVEHVFVYHRKVSLNQLKKLHAQSESTESSIK